MLSKADTRTDQSDEAKVTATECEVGFYEVQVPALTQWWSINMLHRQERREGGISTKEDIYDKVAVYFTGSENAEFET